MLFAALCAGCSRVLPATLINLGKTPVTLKRDNGAVIGQVPPGSVLSFGSVSMGEKFTVTDTRGAVVAKLVFDRDARERRTADDKVLVFAVDAARPGVVAPLGQSDWSIAHSKR